MQPSSNYIPSYNSRSAGQILLLDQAGLSSETVVSVLKQELPDAHMQVVRSIEEYALALQSRSFDVVLIDLDLSEGNVFELIQRARLSDYEPGVLVLAGDEDAKTATKILNSGCLRYIVRDQEWSSQLAPAIRQAMRIRKLEEENRSLLGRLTESNRLLEERSRRLDEFSATIAHDIRGIIGNVSMRIEYVLESDNCKLENKLKLILVNAHGALKRLTDLVQSTYDFARLGAKACKMSSVNLDALVNEVVQDLEVESKLNIQINLQSLPEVWGNSELLRRVFINLLSNAVKHSDKPNIEIEIKHIADSETPLTRYAEIWIKDNGPGIPEREIASIFQMFWQGKVSDISANGQSSDKGQGIGLAVVKRIVELHYGEISVESTLGRSTTFKLLLPIQQIEGLNL